MIFDKFLFLAFLFPTSTVGIFLENVQKNWKKYERGSLPTPIEMVIMFWLQGLIWKSLKEFFKVGLLNFLMNLWNLADIFSYGSFMGWIGLRAIAFAWVWKLRWDGLPEDEIWIPRSMIYYHSSCNLYISNQFFINWETIFLQHKCMK